MNRIDSILKQLDAPTSAAAPITKTAAARGSALDNEIDNVIAKLEGGAKTASAQSGAAPVADLLKMANELRESDADSQVKLARRMGAAFTDGAVERSELYRKEAEALQKTAAAEEREALEKFAAENPAQYAALVAQGFFDNGGSTKEAAEDYDAGFIEKAAEIHAITQAHFIEGYSRIEDALRG